MPKGKIPVILLAFVLLFAGSASAQDLKIRQEAATLMERAFAVSIPPDRGSFLQTVTFRTFSPDQGTLEGKYVLTALAPNTFRSETDYGSFHFLYILNHGHVATVKNQEVAPFAARRVTTLVPIHLVRFDHADVILAIKDDERDGKPIRCIEFDSTYGEKTDHNEACVDPQLGTLVHLKVADETIDNYDFFQFRGAYAPRRIRYSKNDLTLDLEQSITDLPQPLDANIFTDPPGAQTGTPCREYRRPIGLSMPQPKPGDGSQNVDIVVYGEVRADGRIHEATVDDSSRPDLNAEAISIIKSWTFTPASCNGQTTFGPIAAVLHFVNR